MYARDDLLEFCLDQVEDGFHYYLDSSNGNPLVYDKVRTCLCIVVTSVVVVVVVVVVATVVVVVVVVLS